MLKRIPFKDLLLATLLSVLIFVFITVLTYLQTLEGHAKFKVGFPWIFYYQFLIDCGIQHGGDGEKLLWDCAVTWIAVVAVWIALKRNKPVRSR